MMLDCDADEAELAELCALEELAPLAELDEASDEGMRAVQYWSHRFLSVYD